MPPPPSPCDSPGTEGAVHPLIARLVAGAPVLADGAYGTMLLARVRPGEVPDALNVTEPGAVRALTAAYAAAGSAVVVTNTFRANRIGLARSAVAGRVAEVNAAGVAIARAAAPGAAVFGAMGPTGALLGFAGPPEHEIRAAFAEQAAALAAAGADALLVETMGDLGEALVALAAATATGLPVVVSLAFGAGRDGDRTPMGQTPEAAAATLAAAGAAAVGANCALTPGRMAGVIERLRAATALPVWAKPNAGAPALAEDGSVSWPCAPEEFARQAAALAAAGATFVGGCCGTTPAHVAALRAALPPA